MNIDLLRQELIRYEGYKITVYLDTKGLPTVGIGHMDKTMKVGTQYTPQQINDLFAADVSNAIKIADNLNLKLDEIRYRVLVQLCFNLGNKILQFHHFVAGLQAGNWDMAANELKNSLWYTQVGNRGPETCYAIRNSKYEWSTT